MPKIDLSNLKKSKKKRPWASIDELLNPTLGSETTVSEEIKSSSQKELPKESDDVADSSAPDFDQILTNDGPPTGTKFNIGENSKSLVINDQSTVTSEVIDPIAAKSDKITPIPNYLPPYSSGETDENKSSIEILHRISIDSTDTEDDICIESIEIPPVKPTVCIDSVHDSIHKSIQTPTDTTPNDPRLQLPIPLATSLTSLVKIGSKQYTILLYLFKTIGETGDYLTKEISASELSNVAKTSIGSTRSAINELIDKNLIKRKFFSKAGWTVYEFTKSSFQLVLKYTQNITDHNLYRIYTDHTTQIYIDSPPSKYVGNINNNTIHTEHTLAQSTPTEPDLWSELRDVDFSQLHQLGIKVTIVDTFKKNKWVIDRFQLEDFIERFHRYMTEPQFEDRRSKIKNPYSFFLGSVKDIANGEPHSLCDVKTEYELQKEVALKNRSKQVDEFERLVQDQQNRLNQLLDSRFNSWIESLTPDEQIALVPPQAMAKPGSVSYKQLLKAYFTENIWSKSEHSFLNSPRA